MNKKAILIISSILLIGAGIGVFFYFKNKDKDTSDEDESGDTSGDDKKASEKEIADALKSGALTNPDNSEYSAKNKIVGKNNFPLKIGSKGRRVAVLQAMLNEVNDSGLTIDGVFGNDTRFALAKHGFPSCVIAANCEVSQYDLGVLSAKIKDKTAFAKKYKSDSEMKAVYDKYSS